MCFGGLNILAPLIAFLDDGDGNIPNTSLCTRGEDPVVEHPNFALLKILCGNFKSLPFFDSSILGKSRAYN